jgi:integrase
MIYARSRFRLALAVLCYALPLAAQFAPPLVQQLPLNRFPYSRQTVEEVPYPKAPRGLPIILTQEEAVRLIDSASNLYHRAMLMTDFCGFRDIYLDGCNRSRLMHKSSKTRFNKRFAI